MMIHSKVLVNHFIEALLLFESLHPEIIHRIRISCLPGL
jgi:hypothetical protein